MNDSAAVQAAARDLAALRQQVDATRGVLTSLLQQVVEAANRLDSGRTALLEANEHLVIAALRAQADAEAAARALHEASRTAQFDALTQLPNRLLLLDRFAQALANAERHGCRMALLFVDLDKFKQINDTLGHAVGDEVLKLAAQCLGASVRAADTVSRHGGDEFLILLAEVSQASDAARVADKVFAAFGAEHRVAGHALRLTASLGIAIYPDDGEEADTLIHRADAAMYRAKRHGPGGFAFHGDATASPPIAAPLLHPLAQAEQALAEHENRCVPSRHADTAPAPAAVGARQRRSPAQQEDLLALLVHELRDPLTPLRKAVTLLGRARSRGPLPRRVQAVIERQVAHLSRLLGDLLDLSSRDTVPPGPEHRQLDMACVVEEAVERCRPAIDARRQRRVER